jgi:hypothetical protein
VQRSTPDLCRHLAECAAVNSNRSQARCSLGTSPFALSAPCHQVSLWRNWAQTGPTDVSKFRHGPVLTHPGGLEVGARLPPDSLPGGWPTAAAYSLPSGGVAAERVGLILPTSLCSGEVARQITRRLNALIAAAASATLTGAEAAAAAALASRVTRFECLPHTEGCGTG